MASDKARFQTAQSHIDKGTKLRNRGMLGEALLEFQRAYAINPSSAAAEQDLRRTREMIEVERKKVQESVKESPPEERALTPAERAKKEANDRIDRILPVPDLKPLNPDPIRLKMSGQPKLLFETVAKLAGLNVLWDPNIKPRSAPTCRWSSTIPPWKRRWTTWPSSPSPTGSRSRPTPSSSPWTTPTSGATMRSRWPKSSTSPT